MTNDMTIPDDYQFKLPDCRVDYQCKGCGHWFLRYPRSRECYCTLKCHQDARKLQRHARYLRHRDTARVARAHPERNCVVCGDPISYSRSTRKFCKKSKCRQQAYRDRHRARVSVSNSGH